MTREMIDSQTYILELPSGAHHEFEESRRAYVIKKALNLLKLYDSRKAILKRKDGSWSRIIYK